MKQRDGGEPGDEATYKYQSPFSSPGGGEAKTEQQTGKR